MTAKKLAAITAARAEAAAAQKAYFAALVKLRKALNVTKKQDEGNSVEGTMEKGDMCLENLPLAQWPVDELVEWSREARGEA